MHSHAQDGQRKRQDGCSDLTGMSTSLRWFRIAWAALLGMMLVGNSGAATGPGVTPGKKEKTGMTMTITSTSFVNNHAIPARHTCDGVNVSPLLEWAGVPPETKSLAVRADDPDAPDPAAPKTTWVHWVVYNIPPDATGLPETTSGEALPPGTLQGQNDWHQTGYRGPCPPIGKHRYFFKLYALDVVLPDLKHPSKATLEKAMHGHMLAHSELIGLYQRPFR